MTNSIKVIGLTQGANIDIFLKCLKCLPQLKCEVVTAGAVVSFAHHFQSSEVVKGSSDEISFIKEWDIVDEALKNVDTIDPVKLREMETPLSAAAVWKAIIADRRLIYGRRAKFSQDYRVHFTDKQLWSIAWHFSVAFEKMLDDIQPDVIIGFTPVTFGELLALEIASARNIPTLQLHSSRIKNYFAFHDKLAGTSDHFHQLMQNNHFSPETRKIAEGIIQEVCDKGLTYEGANKSISKGRKINFFSMLKTAPKVLAKEVLKAIDPVTRHDHHDPGHIIPWLYTQLIQPLREKTIKWRLKKSGRMVYDNQSESSEEYCFFPLQSEPEVSIQVLGRPYHKNQIELLRNLAASLPAGMKLYVKEHPRSLGLRPYSYYKELFNIPNLYIVDVQTPSMPMVGRSSFVAVISGTIGFEAIMAGKPVLIFGFPKYEGIPGEMTKKCFNLFEMPQDIRQLLTNYTYNKETILLFLSSLIEGSVAIDLYSALLRKPGRQSFQNGKISQEENIKLLTQHMIKRICEVTK